MNFFNRLLEQLPLQPAAGFRVPGNKAPFRQGRDGLWIGAPLLNASQVPRLLQVKAHQLRRLSGNRVAHIGCRLRAAHQLDILLAPARTITRAALKSGGAKNDFLSVYLTQFTNGVNP